MSSYEYMDFINHTKVSYPVLAFALAKTVICYLLRGKHCLECKTHFFQKQHDCTSDCGAPLPAVLRVIPGIYMGSPFM